MIVERVDRRRLGMAGAVLAAAGLIAGCAPEGGLDWDLRRNGFSTSEAARGATGARPQPDARGVITYPGYQVAVARSGESVQDMAARLGIGAEALARQNALAADATLRGGELLILPERVAPGADATGGDDAISVSPLAAPGTAAAPGGAEPVRHTVARGETAFSIARLYSLPVRAIADWNGLPADLSVREGQVLIIPVAQSVSEAAAQTGSATTSAPVQVPATLSETMLPAPTPTPEPQRPASEPATPAPTTPAPGQGSPTPTPPSASQPLPQETPTPAGQSAAEPETPPVADMSGQRSDTPSLAMPVQGRIIRAYQRGRNDGIGIGAPAGAEVRAAAAGTVAAITRDTDQVPILVIRHANNLLTVYANIDNITVERGAQVRAGQNIARVRRGDPSFLHFEVREGLESVDPMRFLQ